MGSFHSVLKFISGLVPFEWKRFGLEGIAPKVPSISNPVPDDSSLIPPHLWGDTLFRKPSDRLPTHSGYVEARSLIGNGNLLTLADLSSEASKFVSSVFDAVASKNCSTSSTVVRLRLSEELQQWKAEQHKQGNILPTKGKGLRRASEEVLRLLGASNWPEPLITTNALFGCGITNLLVGGHDPNTVMSSYVTDMAFYYEHGYHLVFPELEGLIKKGVRDSRARRTLGGSERRAAVEIGIKYIRGKISLEEQHKADLSYLSARLDRRTAQIVCLCESSLFGMIGEAVGMS